jgi:hypothetical protein
VGSFCILLVYMGCAFNKLIFTDIKKKKPIYSMWATHLSNMGLGYYNSILYLINKENGLYFDFLSFGYINPQRSINHCSNNKATIPIPNPKIVGLA